MTRAVRRCHLEPVCAARASKADAQCWWLTETRARQRERAPWGGGGVESWGVRVERGFRGTRKRLGGRWSEA